MKPHKFFIGVAVLFSVVMATIAGGLFKTTKQPDRTEIKSGVTNTTRQDGKKEIETEPARSNTPTLKSLPPDSRVDEIIAKSKEIRAENERKLKTVKGVTEQTGITCSGTWFYDDACQTYLQKLAEPQNTDIVSALKKIHDNKIYILISSLDQAPYINESGDLVISSKSNSQELRKFLGLNK